MKALFFNPHDDDAIIGVGGVIVKLLSKGCDVGYAYLTDGRHGSNIMSPEETLEARVAEAAKEREFLGIKKFYEFRVEDGKLSAANKEEVKAGILKALDDFNPDLIFIPSQADSHSDHRAAHDYVMEVVKESRQRLLVAKFIVWQFPDFYKKRKDIAKRVYLVNIDAEINKKMCAIRLHASQIKEGRYDEIASSISSYYGKLFKAYRKEGAEAAEIIALFNRSRANRQAENELLSMLDQPRDITTIFHGRDTEKIKI